MKFAIFLFLFSLSAHAEKIFFSYLGEQQVIDFGIGGHPPDKATILWKESVDGPLPAGIPIGYAKRVGNSIVEDADLKAAWDAKIAAEADAAKQAALDATAFKALKDKIKAGTATAAEVRTAFAYLLKKLGE